MVPGSNKATNDRPEKTCGTCKGKGTVDVKDAAGAVVKAVTCPACHGAKTGPGLMRK